MSTKTLSSRSHSKPTFARTAVSAILYCVKRNFNLLSFGEEAEEDEEECSVVSKVRLRVCACVCVCVCVCVCCLCLCMCMCK